MEYANFKMRCVNNKYNEDYYTEGKIYEVIDGKFIDDYGDVIPKAGNQPIKDFKYWLRRTTARWELVEESEKQETSKPSKPSGVIVCKGCDKTFELSADERYTAISKNFSTSATIEYDAFDCPYCGCQNIAGERFPRKFEEKEV